MLRPLALRRALAAAGVLGINRRNAELISIENPRRLYPLVDDKLRTKELALQAGMAVPELYGVISSQREIAGLPEIVAEREEFVLKPAHGSGGNGILVIKGRRRGRYRRASGLFIDEDELEHHLSNAISGLYSLGGQRDRVMVEYCVRFDPLFEAVTYQGVPDIRIVVFRGVPTMAMVRLPTRQSDGKANLHQGAIGVGVDLASGRTLGGVQGNDRVDEHPDTGLPIAGIEIPGWETMLALAARCHDITGLGYLGVDLVLDRALGPLILELNARPGLNIQIANGVGLRGRLEVVRHEADPRADLAERVAFARERFGVTGGSRA